MASLARSLLLFLFCIGGCGLTDPASDLVIPVSYREIERTAYGNELIQGLRLATTPDQLTSLWSDIAWNVIPPPSPADVDFDAEIVIAYFMGGRGSGGYAAYITGVFNNSGRLEVDVTESSPGSGCGVDPAPCGPVVVIAAERWDGPVVPRVKRHEYDCN
jgi:hypothetical protein